LPYSINIERWDEGYCDRVAGFGSVRNPTAGCENHVKDKAQKVHTHYARWIRLYPHSGILLLQ